MTEPTQPHKPGNYPMPGLPEADPTVDLTHEEFGEGEDLQAIADEFANYEPEAPGPEATGLSREDLEAELAKARSRLEVLEKAESEHKDKHHRLMADFTNHRNRVSRETQLAVTLAERKVLLEVLSVADSLERCASAKYNSVEDFHSGVLLIQKQMNEALRKAGVEALEVHVGDPFDAQHAEALTTTTQPSLPDGSVAAIYERGFMLRDQLLRPARVIVNNNPDAGSSQNPS